MTGASHDAPRALALAQGSHPRSDPTPCSWLTLSESRFPRLGGGVTRSYRTPHQDRQRHLHEALCAWHPTGSHNADFRRGAETGGGRCPRALSLQGLAVGSQPCCLSRDAAWRGGKCARPGTSRSGLVLAPSPKLCDARGSSALPFSSGQGRHRRVILCWLF